MLHKKKSLDIFCILYFSISLFSFHPTHVSSSSIAIDAMSSYVPPHLRSSSAVTAGTGSAALKTNSEKSRHDTSAPSSFLRHYSSSMPDPVFEKWIPSDRVSRLLLHQVEEVRERLNVDVTVSSESPLAPSPIETFTDMNLNVSIMKDIVAHGYTIPTPIQAQAMPIALSGRDLLGCAETGSGKTAAFSIPMIQHCLSQIPIQRGDGPLALVLAPTRELAQQIEKEVKAFSRSLNSFKASIIVGGTNISEQKSELREGVQIVVATPGRFIDHLQQRNTSLSRISYVVLDEADRMLDMGFEPQIRDVMRNLPKKHQTLLFSATMPVEIETLAQEYLNKPVQVKVGKVSSPTANVSQTLVKVPEGGKLDQLLSLIVEQTAQAEKSGYPLPLAIVFVERK
ncbi:putative ATP-dependent RNA helicase, partial [Zostera marina]